MIDRIASDPALLGALRAARARARENAWEAGAAPERIVIDIDATLITAHSENDGAAGTFTRGFGVHPLLAYLDGSREALARVRFLMGDDFTAGVRGAILALPEAAWGPAIRQDGEVRESAWVAEITHRLDLTGWPDGSRVIVRRERPHPGAQLSFTDHDGHRFLATLTDLAGNAAELERLHRARASAEDRVGTAKQTGMENLPFRDFDHNQVWLGLSLIAQDPIAWTQHLALDGARRLRAQDAALPAPAHRWTARLPRPPRNPAPATQLAVGQRASRRLRAPARAATTGGLTAPRPSDDHQRTRPARPS